MRYVNLSNILALKLIAPKVDKRFPSYQTLVDAKVLLPKEVKQLIRMNKLVIRYKFQNWAHIHPLLKWFIYLSKAERLERVASQTPHEVSWTPLLWAMKLLAKAKAEDKITIDPPSYANLQGSFEKIESVNRKLLRYAWVNFPLAYTQVRQKFKIMIFSDVSIPNMMIKIFIISFIHLFTGR